MNDAPARAAPARPVAAAPGPAAARGHGARPAAARRALPAAGTALLATGAAAAGSHGAVSAGWVLGLAAVIVAAAAAARPGFTPLAALAGWLTACGFSAPPYAQLRLAGPGAGRAAVVIGAAAVGGVLLRWLASVTLGVMNAPRAPGGRLPLARGLDRRRQLAGVAMVALMPLLTMALEPARHSLSLPDDLLIYLVGVVAVAVVGGFWAALLAAVAGSLLVNWYFTPPVHTFTIADPQNMLSLLLFVTVAVAVSSVVHLAARRAGGAQRRGRRRAARARADRARRAGHARRDPRPPHRDPGGQRRAGRAGGRAVGPRGVLGHRAGRRAPHVGPGRPGPHADRGRAGRAAHPAAARRPGRPGRRRAGPRPAADPGCPGGGAGRGEPDAHRAARR